MGYHYQFSIKTLLSKMEKTEEIKTHKKNNLVAPTKKKNCPSGTLWGLAAF